MSTDRMTTAPVNTLLAQWPHVCALSHSTGSEALEHALGSIDHQADTSSSVCRTGFLPQTCGKRAAQGSRCSRLLARDLSMLGRPKSAPTTNSVGARLRQESARAYRGSSKSLASSPPTCGQCRSPAIGRSFRRQTSCKSNRSHSLPFWFWLQDWPLRRRRAHRPALLHLPLPHPHRRVPRA